MYTAIAIIVFFASFAMMVREGLWNNLLNVSAFGIAAVTAFGVFQPITIFVDEKTGGSYTYFLDIVVLWFTFSLVNLVLKVLMQALSGKRVRFKEPFDGLGGTLVGLVGAYLICGFTMATLHTAPMSRDAFGYGVEGNSRQAVESEITQAAGATRPDLVWLGLMETVLSPNSLGGDGFSRSVYVHSYAQHRGAFETAKSWRVDRK